MVALFLNLSGLEIISIFKGNLQDPKDWSNFKFMEFVNQKSPKSNVKENI